MVRGIKQRLCWILVLCLGALCTIACSHTPQQKEAAYLAKGKKLMQERSYQRAMLEFRNAVRTQPEDAEAYYQLALAQLALGEALPAASSLLKTTSLNPKHTAAQLKLAELLASDPEKADLQEAEKRVRMVLDQAPNDPDALNILAVAEWKLGNQAEAEELLNQVTAQFPSNLRSTVNLAKVKLSQKDFPGAEQVFRKATVADPKSAELAIVFGNFYILINQPEQAEEQLRRALQINAQAGPALIALAGLKMRVGNTDEAETLYRRASALPDPKFKPFHAVFLFQTGKREAAVAEFEKLTKQSPADRSLRSRLVAAYVAVNRSSDAEKVLAAALGKNGRDTDALLQRSQLEVRSGRYQAAQADIAKILNFYPDSSMAHYLMGRVYQMRGQTMSQRQEWSEAIRLDPKFLSARFQLAQLLISTNSAQAALDIINEAPAEQKGQPAYPVQRDWALIAAGQKVEARKGVDLALSTSRTPEVLLQDATLRATQGDFEGARKSLEEGLKHNPENIASLNLLVQIYERQKQLPAALEKVKGYLSQKPESAALQQFWGQMLFKKGDLVGARTAFMQVKAIAPGFAGADSWLAQIDLGEGKLDDARNRLTALISANPGDAPAHLLLASVEERAGNMTAAIQHYRKVLEINDHSVPALNNLALLLADYGHSPDEALSFAQKARELAPDTSNVQDTLGWAFYRKGLYSQAIPYLQQAVAKEPTGTRKCHLALAYLRSGDGQRGRALLDATIRTSPELLKATFLQEFLAESQAGDR